MPMRLLILCIMMALLPISAQALELTGLDSGSRVSVSLTETLSVVLAGNPTTGFLWEVAEMDREMLAMEVEPAFVHNSSRAGSAGKFTFSFTPRQPGTTTLRLIYHRPWEKKAAPLQTFDLTVSIPAVEPRINKASYRSSTGDVMQASFDLKLNRVTVRLPDGRSLTLPVVISGSGARYSNETETFWEHQGIGRFFKGETLIFEGAVFHSDQEYPQQ